MNRNQLINTDILVLSGIVFMYPATNGFHTKATIVIWIALLTISIVKSLKQHIAHYKLTHKLY